MSSRILTVSSVNRPGGSMGECRTVASIRMSGNWLEVLGFKTGSRIEVKESPGRIELVATKEGNEQ